MEKKYSEVWIRYNTKSDGTIQCWRIVCDGVEYLTDKVVVNGTIETTKDYMGAEWGFRHHVSIKNAIVDYGVNYTLIRSAENGMLTDLIKTVTYRILGTSVRFGMGFIFTNNIAIASALGFTDLVLKPALYFLHERIWRKAKKS